jgi:hypothetical protein
VVTDFANENFVEIDFPDDIATVETGKNSNTVFAQNFKGQNAVLKMRLLRGSDDDISFQEQLNTQNNNFAAFQTLVGSFIKQVGDGQGNVSYDIFKLAGGVFQKQPAVQANASGTAEQAIVVYTIKFAAGVRVIT